MIPPCLTLSNIRYVLRIKWSNPGKGVASSPTLRCSSYGKGGHLVALDYGRQHFFSYQWTRLADHCLWFQFSLCSILQASCQTKLSLVDYYHLSASYTYRPFSLGVPYFWPCVKLSLENKTGDGIFLISLFWIFILF